VLEEDSHCLRYEIAQGVEKSEHYIVRIEWDSIEGHERGFRASPGFREFFAAVRPFYSEIEEMKHYDNHGAHLRQHLVAAAGRRGDG
jgi:quinol monooxygenase YgiN